MEKQCLKFPNNVYNGKTIVFSIRGFGLPKAFLRGVPSEHTKDSESEKTQNQKSERESEKTHNQKSERF